MISPPKITKTTTALLKVAKAEGFERSKAKRREAGDEDPQVVMDDIKVYESCSSTYKILQAKTRNCHA